MSVIAYKQLMSNVEKDLKDILTASDLEKTMKIISELTACFNIEQIDYPDCTDDFLLDAFLEALEVEGRSKKTIERYKYVLNRLSKATGQPSGLSTTYHIRKFLADEKARGICDNTLRGFREIFSSYFNWLVREELLSKNPMSNIGPIKCQKKVLKAYSDTDIERLKVACKSKRDKAILCFLLATACRVSEVISLNIENVNFEKMECVVFGKGKKERVVYLDPVAAMTLKEYINERKDANQALFVNCRGQRITTSGIRRILNCLSEDSGVEHVHPHKFRRTKATNLIKHGMPIQDVAAILGHDKIDTTMKYLVMDQTTIGNEYRKYA